MLLFDLWPLFENLISTYSKRHYKNSNGYQCMPRRHLSLPGTLLHFSMSVWHVEPCVPIAPKGNCSRTVQRPSSVFKTGSIAFSIRVRLGKTHIRIEYIYMVYILKSKKIFFFNKTNLQSERMHF